MEMETETENGDGDRDWGYTLKKNEASRNLLLEGSFTQRG